MDILKWNFKDQDANATQNDSVSTVFAISETMIRNFNCEKQITINILDKDRIINMKHRSLKTNQNSNECISTE